MSDLRAKMYPERFGYRPEDYRKPPERSCGTCRFNDIPDWDEKPCWTCVDCDEWKDAKEAMK